MINIIWAMFLGFVVGDLVLRMAVLVNVG